MIDHLDIYGSGLVIAAFGFYPKPESLEYTGFETFDGEEFYRMEYEGHNYGALLVEQKVERDQVEICASEWLFARLWPEPVSVKLLTNAGYYEGIELLLRAFHGGEAWIYGWTISGSADSALCFNERILNSEAWHEAVERACRRVITALPR